MSELHDFGSFAKRTERCRRILHIEHLRVTVVLVVHTAQIRVGIQHRLLRFKTVILDELTRHTDPRAVTECADLCLGICRELL